MRAASRPGGSWGRRLTINRAKTIAHGFEQLEASGALDNFRHAARRSGRYSGGIDDAGLVFPFLDSDVYKWLEAVGWELGRADDAGLAAVGAEVSGQVMSAQRGDGYLNTFVRWSTACTRPLPGPLLETRLSPWSRAVTPCEADLRENSSTDIH